ncbi:hypothetical protein AALP_AA4G180300 [Arabis alpina]|uniref:Uncharacterized protein n=1 Tax=Arabis alpina TaxID=50452 RepID=A0A087H402_ARAAL|nr:hypothetical protein AALP_AA4G180300 [Arabis alpina]
MVKEIGKKTKVSFRPPTQLSFVRDGECGFVTLAFAGLRSECGFVTLAFAGLRAPSTKLEGAAKVARRHAHNLVFPLPALEVGFQLFWDLL